MATSDSRVTGLDSNAIYYEVSPTIICIMRLYNVLALLMVLIAFVICLIKGHESESNYLLACNLVPVTWNYADISKPASGKLDIRALAGSLSSTDVARHDGKQSDTPDILDLQRITEAMVESRKARSSRLMDEADLRRYTPLAEADFEEIRKTDGLLEQAYDLYFKLGIDKAPGVKCKTEAMIARLQNKPHFYCPYEREETTDVHVSRWLNKHTSNPEKELIGFTSKDPYEPKRYIPSVTPRAVTSDTNVVLGKRKRDGDDADTVCVSTSSSESRLVCDRGNRPKKVRRAR